MTYPFHMPGHKSNPRFLYRGLLGADITEIHGADVLCRPNGVLKNLQQRLAKLFGSGESLLLVNGATCGVMAATLAAANRGDTIIAARNSHKSFFAGLQLSGAKAVYIMPEATDFGFAGSVSPQAVETALKNNPDAKAVFITSPTYEGVVSDIRAISAVAKRYGAALIVDEAHGAHFVFSDYFPQTALEQGADIAVQSLHKTLTALTQTAVLHVRRGFCETAFSRIQNCVNQLQTSSPSYIIAAQADFMTGMLENDADKLFADYTALLSDFRKKARRLETVRLIDGGDGIFGMDLGKLVFRTQNCTGRDIERHLRDTANVQIEMAANEYIIAITSVADTHDGFGALLEGLDHPGGCEMRVAATSHPVGTRIARPVTLMQYTGKTCNAILTPIPPGVPLIVPGEVLTKEILQTLARLFESGTAISGIDEKDGEIFIDTQ